MIKPLTLSQRLLERADASDEDCRTDDGDIMREADDALKAKDSEIAKLREALEKIEKAPAWGAPDKWEPTPAEVRQLAREALKEAM